MQFAAAKKKLYETHKKVCSACKRNHNIEVHHKDFNPHNNSLSNLKVLCCWCHRETHDKSKNKGGTNGFKKLVVELDEREHLEYKNKCAESGVAMGKTFRALIRLWVKGKVKV